MSRALYFVLCSLFLLVRNLVSQSLESKYKVQPLSNLRHLLPEKLADFRECREEVPIAFRICPRRQAQNDGSWSSPGRG